MCTQDDRFYVSKLAECEKYQEWLKEKSRMEAVKELSKIVVFSCDRKKVNK